jgi:ribosomal protein S18 acetylase RimI-like enzyme
LKHVLEHAELPSSTGSKIAKVYLHVQINNEEAIEFYKKHGFEVTEECQGYYPQFEVSDALRLEKAFN